MMKIHFKYLHIYSMCIFFSSVIIAQEKEYTSEFKNEILKNCSVCFKDSNAFDKPSDDSFHQSHYLFLNKEIDSSYIYITQLLSKKRIENNEKLYILYTIKGRVFLKKDLLDEASISFQKAIEIGKQYKSASLNNQYALLGFIYKHKRDFLKAIEVLETWKSSYDENSLSNRINLHNLGLCYLHTEQYEKAQKNLLESYRLNQKYKDTLGLARSSLDIANLYYQQYKDDLAIPFFEKGLVYAKSANDLQILQNAYLNLAVVEENRKDFSKALNYRKEYEKVKDSIWNRDQIWETAQNDKKIAQTINEEKLKAEKQEKFFYITIAILALILLLFLSYFYILIRKQNTVIKELNATKNKLFSILTHDLKTPIHTLKAKLFNIIKQKEKVAIVDEQHMKELSNITEGYDLAKNTALLIDNTLHWTLQHQNKLLFHQNKLHVASILEHVVYDYLPIMEENKLNLITDINDAFFVYADANSLKIVLRNVLDNAIKFSSQNEKITIKTTENETSCILQIIDEGIGFDTSNFILKKTVSTTDTKGNTSTGLGLQLSRELIEKNGGNFTISSKPNEGTTVFITLPTNTS